ncbi:MAG: class I SAM-dependent methyltransferase, partial [Planctomycetota bacterium]|nr:class I SAM-dependent methyltransferase [Planctomycetota bacterium]
EKLRHVVRETRRKEFYNPVLHDQYRRARIVRPDSIRIDRIRRLFGADGSGSRGLDIGCNMGYTSHMLQRHGVNMTGIDFDESHLSVARALDQTYGLGTPFVSGRFEQFDASEKFDIVVLLTVMYHALNVGQKEAIDMIKHIDRLDASVLVWESGSYAKREIELIRENSGLTTYLPLGSTQGSSYGPELPWENRWQRVTEGISPPNSNRFPSWDRDSKASTPEIPTRWTCHLKTRSRYLLG